MVLGPQTTLTLKRSTSTMDSMGSYTETWVSIETITGVFYAEWGQEVVQNRKDIVLVNHVFICDIPTILPTEKDILVDSSGQIYDILFVDNVAVANHHLEILLNRRT